MLDFKQGCQKNSRGFMDYSTRRERIRIPLKLSKLLLNTVFVIALATLCTLSVVSYYNFKDLIQANHWVTHSYEVINDIDETLYALTAMESDQRGYLISDNKDFLRKLDSNKKKIQRFRIY